MAYVASTNNTGPCVHATQVCFYMTQVSFTQYTHLFLHATYVASTHNTGPCVRATQVSFTQNTGLFHT